MARIALIVAYNGRNYHGWQYQGQTTPTIQRELTAALCKVADSDLILHAAGRTDSGVHATKQVVHFDTLVSRPDKAWVFGANTHLPRDISVEWASEVSDHFDARRSAFARRYIYIIHNAKVRSALMQDYLSHEHRLLDADAMHQAAQALVGENDFSSFRAAHCQSVSPMRNLMHINVNRKGDLVIIDVRANAFLHHMVRNIVGTLLKIGRGEKDVNWMNSVLQSKDRKKAGPTAEPQGLYFIKAFYKEI